MTIHSTKLAAICTVVSSAFLTLFIVTQGEKLNSVPKENMQAIN